ncbi:hypothetical protein [Streptomyces sp. NPDC049040]|uniref:hypothetical protein n=1 Tax=Streptomyces sp. NPDC049040 TaxID=3365593 RepID=UPI0037134D73
MRQVADHATPLMAWAMHMAPTPTSTVAALRLLAYGAQQPPWVPVSVPVSVDALLRPGAVTASFPTYACRQFARIAARDFRTDVTIHDRDENAHPLTP